MRASVYKSIQRKEDFKKYKIQKCTLDGILEYNFEHGTCEYGMLELARQLRKTGRYEEARYYFTYLLDTKNEDYALLELIKLEFKLNNFEACLRHLNRLFEIDRKTYEELEFGPLKYYILMRLGKTIKYDKDKIRYTDLMIFKYDERWALEHIKSHDLKKYIKYFKNGEGVYSSLEFDITKCDESFFNDAVDIEALFHELREMLKCDLLEKEKNESIFQHNIIKYLNVGNNVRGRLDYLEVVSIRGTNNIITMYPIRNIDKAYYLSGNVIYDYDELKEQLKEKQNQNSKKHNGQ